MSAYSTSSPSIAQTRWYLIRPPSLAWTWRNDTSCDSVAAYSFTGTLTSPNDTAPFQIARISYLRVAPTLDPVSRSGGQIVTCSAQPVGHRQHRGRAPGGHAKAEQPLQLRCGVRRSRLVVDGDRMPPVRVDHGQSTGAGAQRERLGEVVATVVERDLGVAVDVCEVVGEVVDPARRAHRRDVAPVGAEDEERADLIADAGR